MNELPDDPRVRMIVEALLHAPAEVRSAMLDRLVAGDAALREAVEAAMLRESATSNLPVALESATVSTSRRTPPSKIGPYRIERELGHGGFGVVYHAVDTRGGRRAVALKVLRADRATDAVEAAFFRREVSILRSLRHACIAEFIDAGVGDAGERYVAMELVQGVSLTEYCDSQRLTVAQRLRIFCLVCEAVRHAHNRGVVHRDLKPANILVTAQREPKIVDFGIAAFIDADRAAREEVATVSHMRPLTPEYASPELLRGQFTKDCRIDVYALGVVLYELLSGVRPFVVPARFEHERFATVIESTRPPRPSDRLVDTVPSLTAGVADGSASPATTVAERRGTTMHGLRRALHGDLDRIVLMAIRPEIDRRYQQVGDLLDDVERSLRGEPVRAGPDSRVYRLSKVLRRNRTAVGVVSGSVIAVILALGAGWYYSAKARNAETARADAESALAHEATAREKAETARAEVESKRVTQVMAISRALSDEIRDMRGDSASQRALATAAIRSLAALVDGPTSDQGQLGDKHLVLFAQAEMANALVNAWVRSFATESSDHVNAKDLEEAILAATQAESRWASLIDSGYRVTDAHLGRAAVVAARASMDSKAAPPLQNFSELVAKVRDDIAKARGLGADPHRSAIEELRISMFEWDAMYDRTSDAQGKAALSRRLEAAVAVAADMASRAAAPSPVLVQLLGQARHKLASHHRALASVLCGRPEICEDPARALALAEVERAVAQTRDAAAALAPFPMAPSADRYDIEMACDAMYHHAGALWDLGRRLVATDPNKAIERLREAADIDDRLVRLAKSTTSSHPDLHKFYEQWSRVNDQLGLANRSLKQWVAAEQAFGLAAALAMESRLSAPRSADDWRQQMIDREVRMTESRKSCAAEASRGE